MADVGWNEVFYASSFGRGFGPNNTAVDDTTLASLPASSMWFGGYGTNMFYTTNGAGSGTYGDSAFTSIDPTLYTNLQFSLYSQYGWQGNRVQTWFTVQVGGAWYVSTNHPMMPNTAGGNLFHRTDMTYSPVATNWNILTVGTLHQCGHWRAGRCADLSGPITGIGFVTDPGNDGWGTFNEFLITSISNTAAIVPPTLVAAPLSQYYVYAGGGVSFKVGVSPSQSYDYYWQKGGVTLTNDSRISGVNSATLTILNATAADDGNYSVIVSNSAGFFDTSTNSAGPAYLNVNTLPADYLYAETFPFVGPSTSISYSLGTVGWSCSVPDNTNRLFYNSSYASGTISSSESYSQTFPLADFFYATTNSDTGISGVPFTAIDPTAHPAIAFSVDVVLTSNWYNSPGNTTAYFAVQMNGGSWYVSSIPIPVNISPTNVFATYEQQFHSSASLWKNLTFTSTGATIGSTATADLTGQITGAGVVVVVTYVSEWDFENFAITTDSVAVIAPVIDHMPRNQTVYAGGGASLQVHVPGTGTQPSITSGNTTESHLPLTGSPGRRDMLTITGRHQRRGQLFLHRQQCRWLGQFRLYGTATLTVNPVPVGLLYAETLPTSEVPDGFYPIGTVGWLTVIVWVFGQEVPTGLPIFGRAVRGWTSSTPPRRRTPAFPVCRFRALIWLPTPT